MITPRPRPPSVERLLAALRPRAGPRAHDAFLVAVRETVDAERERLRSGENPRTLDALADAVVARLDAHAAGAPPTSAINATGVIVHTNLGRAPWPEAAIRAASRQPRAALPGARPGGAAAAIAPPRSTSSP